MHASQTDQPKSCGDLSPCNYLNSSTPTDEDQKVASAFCDEIGKPRTIAELTKERLRLAAKKIKEREPDVRG